MGNLLTIKPHHFLDYLYDLAINNRHEEPNTTGSNNGFLCCKFIDGYFDSIKFTPFVDDICSPCKRLKNGICLDTFDDETTKLYGFRNKNDFNYNLDIQLNKALPHIFEFNTIQSMCEVLSKLDCELTKEIINLYLWERPNRSELTFLGIHKALQIYK